MGSFVGSLLGTNSTNVAALPAIEKQDILPQINTANQNVQSNIGNQNAFAQALQTQMGGGGPNLAGSQLASATGQNVSNQAALMASQRGTGSNAGLIARQAANQGANIQQQAAGQAATERAQQQLNAQGQLGNTYGQIGSEAGNALSTLEGAQSAQNNAIVGGTTSTNATNAQTAAGNARNTAGMISGVGSALAAAEGGEISKRGIKSPLPSHLKDISDIYHPHMSSSPGNMEYAKGGKVDAMVSPGERFLKPDAVKKVAEGKADPIKSGEKIPGKPKVPGAVDSYANDTVPKKLEEGGIVIPRHITMGKNPGKDASAFVMAIIDKQGKKRAKK